MPTQLQGTLRIILEPLLVDKPFVGAVTVFFLQKPVSSKPRDRPSDPHEQIFGPHILAFSLKMDIASTHHNWTPMFTPNLVLKATSRS